MRLGLLLTLLIFSGQFSFAKPAALKSKLHVTESKVFLSDLIVEEDSLLRSKTSQILVAELSLGDEVTLKSQEVSRLARRVSDVGQFYIPSEIKIRRIHKAENFEEEIIQHIKKTSSADRVEVLEFRYPEKALLSSSKSIQLALPDKFKNGTFNLPLFDTEKGQRRNIGWVSGRYRSFKVVPVARKSLSIGSLIMPEYVTFSERDITRISDKFPSEKELYSSVVRLPRQVNQIISLSDLKKKKLVKRGEPIKAVIKSRDWEINVTGLARSGGYHGDSVKFYNPETRKMLTAKVIGKGLVEIIK